MVDCALELHRRTIHHFLCLFCIALLEFCSFQKTSHWKKYYPNSLIMSRTPSTVCWPDHRLRPCSGRWKLGCEPYRLGIWHCRDKVSQNSPLPTSTVDIVRDAFDQLRFMSNLSALVNGLLLCTGNTPLGSCNRALLYKFCLTPQAPLAWRLSSGWSVNSC